MRNTCGINPRVLWFRTYLIMKYAIATTALAGIVLAAFCLMAPPTPEGHIPLFLLAVIGGALCTYVYSRGSVAETSLERSAIVGCSAGLVGGLLCFGSTALVLFVLGKTEVVLNTHSLNLAILGLVELGLASGFGGLVTQIALRGRRNSAGDKDSAHETHKF